MINFVFLVPSEPEAKHIAHVASKRGMEGQPPKGTGFWEGVLKALHSIERGGSRQGCHEGGRRVAGSGGAGATGKDLVWIAGT